VITKYWETGLKKKHAEDWRFRVVYASIGMDYQQNFRVAIVAIMQMQYLIAKNENTRPTHPAKHASRT
jgi:hypothetical protein